MSARPHSYSAIQSDHFAVEHLVLNDMFRQGGVLAGATEARGEWHLLAERNAGGFRQSAEQWSIENTGGDGHDADAVAGQVARDGQRHTHDAALRRRVGCLTDLSIEGCHRGSVDNYAALATRVGLVPAMASAARRIELNVPIRFIWMTRVNAARLCGPFLPSTRWATPIPAQLISTCKPPNVSTAILTAAASTLHW